MNNGIIATQHTASNVNRGKMFLTKGNIEYLETYAYIDSVLHIA
jgi:hypothetical protein